MKDINLKLAIIQALRDIKKLPKFNKKKFWKETFGEAYDMFAEYNYESVPEIITYYEDFIIPEELFKEIEQLFWFPSYKIKTTKIHNDINDQWDGEDSQFQITSLEGIELCENLKVIHFDTLGVYSQGVWDRPTTYVSLKPLKSLIKLENFLLYDSLVDDIEVIEQMENLKKVKLHNIDTLKNTDLQKIKESLENKNVEITIL